MSRTTDTAHILPISDLVPSRDASSKLRLAGLVTAICPLTSLIVLTDPYPTASSGVGSVLVDLSLCTDQTGGWSRKHSQSVPPELKSKVMVIGHLTRRDVPVDISFLTGKEESGWEGVQLKQAVDHFRERWAPPNRYFVLEAILVKPLDHTFDLQLWNHTARRRSQHEWQMYHHDQTHAQEPIAAAGAGDKKGKRKAID